MSGLHCPGHQALIPHSLAGWEGGLGERSREGCICSSQQAPPGSGARRGRLSPTCPQPPVCVNPTSNPAIPVPSPRAGHSFTGSGLGSALQPHQGTSWLNGPPKYGQAEKTKNWGKEQGPGPGSRAGQGPSHPHPHPAGPRHTASAPGPRCPSLPFPAPPFLSTLALLSFPPSLSPPAALSLSPLSPPTITHTGIWL